ncbi:MAG: antitoxin Xre-like helix-turn-helix domain-containing protein [Verrucomicrobiota bacterium]
MSCPRSGCDADRLNQEGDSSEAFASLSAMLDLPQKELAQTLGLNDRTLRTRNRQRLSEVESEKSLRVARVYLKAVGVLGSAGRARSWITSPIKSLGNRRPLDYLETDIGTGRSDERP